jgi:hypothetical protein
MSFSFAELKKNKNKLADSLKQEIEKTDYKKKFEKEEDTRFWQPELDEGGSGYALIRFLPPTIEEDNAFVKMMNYAFQGPLADDGKARWYIENSLQTIGQDDPVQKYNNMLYSKTKSTGDKFYEEQAKRQKRNTFYISNILVLSDKKNPQNEGKVFLFRYGQRVFDKIKDKMFPEFDGEESINIFDFWEGMNFKVKISLTKFKVDGGKEKEYRNWDKCEFDSPSELFGGDDEKIKAVWDKQYKLSEFTSPDKFKTYEELLNNLERTMGVGFGELFVMEQPKASAPKTKKDREVELDDTLDHIIEKKVESKSKTDEDENDLEFFKRLAEED